MRVLILTLSALLLAAIVAHAQSPVPSHALRVMDHFGSVDGPLAFGSIADVASDRGGDIYVADPMDSAIKVLSSSGMLIKTFGRQGNGPGEFASGPARLGWRGDSLWVADYAGQVQLFRRDGTFIRVIYKPRMPIRALVELTPGGAPLMLHRPQMLGSGRGGSPLVLTVVRSHQRLDTLFNLPRPHIDLVVHADGRPVYGSTQPFSDDPIAALSNTARFAVIDFPPFKSVRDAVFRIRVFDLTSSARVPAAVRNVAYVPEQLTDDAVEAAINRQIGGEVGPYFPKDRAEAFRKALYRPRHLRPVNHVLFTSKGHMWVRKSQLSDRSRSEWLLFDPNLKPYGSLAIPEELGYVIAVENDTVWLVQNGELDVPILARATLVRGAK
jgi:hypothetical protein